MSHFTDEARRNIAAATSASGDDRIGLLLPPDANGFRLQIRENLRATRAQRLGNRFGGARFGGGNPQTPVPAPGSGNAPLVAPSSAVGPAGPSAPPNRGAVPGGPGAGFNVGGYFMGGGVRQGAGASMFGPGTFGNRPSIDGPGVTTRGAGLLPTSSTRNADDASAPPHEGAEEFLNSGLSGFGRVVSFVKRLAKPKDGGDGKDEDSDE